jgi:hypothetical protein
MVVSKSDIQSLLMSFLVLIETQPIAMEGRDPRDGFMAFCEMNSSLPGAVAEQECDQI